MSRPAQTFLIVRKACPGYLASKARYLTMQGGWTTDANHAIEFLSRAAAEKTLPGGAGEIADPNDYP